MKKNPRSIKIICAVAVLTTVLGLTSCSCTSCSCGGLGSLSNLISGNSGGGTTTTTTAAESSTETAAATSTTAASETTTAKESATTTTAATTATSATTATIAETTTAHVHDWQYNGEYPSATCTDDGKEWYICSVCGDEYYDVIPALGHDWIIYGGSAPDCIYPGKHAIRCTRCDEYSSYEAAPPLGHDWDFVYHCDATCEDYGYDKYQRKRCGEVETMDYELYPPLGHNMNDYTYGGMGHTRCCDRCGLEFPETFDYHDFDGSCKPKPGEETIYHVYYCKFCGYVGFQEAHHMTTGGYCVDCGYSGPVG